MKQALISVYHKEGVEGVARKLVAGGWRILSSGGTARYLEAHDIPVIPLSSMTGFEDVLNGRVKTLHPRVFAGILADTATKSHREDLQKIGAGKIDMVMVNFYPFESALEQEGMDMAGMVEKIDIGGPSLVRAAAKNFQDTVVVVDPSDYQSVADHLSREGGLDLKTRRELAQKAFSYTSFYDSLIGSYLRENGEGLPPYFSLSGRKKMDLRYGENPHQRGALYISSPRSPLLRMTQHQGKKLSFNNILDFSMVADLLSVFRESADFFSVVVKHQNPCGAALAENQETAFQKALEGDPKSAFGGIVGFNRSLDAPAAKALKKIFMEVIVAPGFSPGALEILRRKKKLRLIELPLDYRQDHDVKTVPGGFVLQDKDHGERKSGEYELKTSRKPSPGELADADFGWKMMKFVKSNGIIIVKDRQLVGVGAGQMSRVDAVELAIMKSRFGLEGAVLLSDAFFPFPDSIEAAAAEKISVVVEPGGSVRDASVIEAAEQAGITLLFTGMRHFRH